MKSLNILRSMVEAYIQERKLSAILAHYKSIKKNTSSLLNRLEELKEVNVEAIDKRVHDPLITFSSDVERALSKMMQDLIPQTQVLLDAYNKDIQNTSIELSIHLDQIQPGKNLEAIYRQILIGCDKIIAIVEASISPLSNQQMDNLGHIKKEVSKICEALDIHFERNLQKAIIELEKGEFLGSALITSRVIVYMLSQMKSFNNLNGENIEQKLNYLIKVGALEGDPDNIRMQIIKTDKIARNIFSHRIDIDAEASDTLSLLSGCIFLMKIYGKAIQINNRIQ
jgi:hypothetical protein